MHTGRLQFSDCLLRVAEIVHHRHVLVARQQGGSNRGPALAEYRAVEVIEIAQRFVLGMCFLLHLGLIAGEFGQM